MVDNCSRPHHSPPPLFLLRPSRIIPERPALHIHTKRFTANLIEINWTIQYMCTTHASEAPISPSPHFQFRSHLFKQALHPIPAHCVRYTAICVRVWKQKSSANLSLIFCVWVFHCTQLRTDISFQNMTRRGHRCIVCRNRLSSAVLFCSFQFRCVFFSITLSRGPSFQSDGNDKHSLAYMHMLTANVYCYAWQLLVSSVQQYECITNVAWKRQNE